MKSVTLFLIVAVSGLVVSSPDSDLIGPILKTINSYANLTRMADYLKQFPESFNQDFPAIAPDGKKAVYTFFFPASYTFTRELPHDAPDPFVLEEFFRRLVFRRHVARRLITPGELHKLGNITMANDEEAVLTRDDGALKINNAEILQDVFHLPNGAGIIYVVDNIFMWGDEVLWVFSSNIDKMSGYSLFEATFAPL